VGRGADIRAQEVVVASVGKHRWGRRRGDVWRACAVTGLAVLALTLPAAARASLLSGEALDTAADVIAWIALIIVPVVAIGIFWLVHILPEKIAEKKRHPQAKAIQVMCLLSLAFGGMLWPVAWLWAYTKPVLHKMAYGTDVDDSHGHGAGEEPEGTVPVLTTEAEVPVRPAAQRPVKLGG
jgi:CBS domain containing-hemolysin-like protein